MSEMSPRLCSVCSSTQQQLLYPRRFTRLSEALIEGYDVVACLNCGFCFASRIPSQDAFDDYYERQSKYEHDNRGGSQSEYDTRRLPFAVSIISEWMPAREARILDIGCANGGLLAELKKNGYENVFGVDPSPACAATAGDLYGIEVMVAPISKIPASIGKFDLVIFGSVLEHIIDFDSTLDRTKALLKTNGRVYAEVPDMTKCTQVNDAAFQEFSVEHVNYFGPISLRNIFTRRRFSPVGVRQTEIEQVAGLRIFEIKAMFQYTGEAAAAFELDKETRPELERYISKSRAKMDPIISVIDQLVKDQTPIVVWGVGTQTQGLLAATELEKTNIRAFVDSNLRYVGQTLAGRPILSIDALKEMEHSILVSSRQFQKEIVDQIRYSLRLPNNIIALY